MNLQLPPEFAGLAVKKRRERCALSREMQAPLVSVTNVPTGMLALPCHFSDYYLSLRAGKSESEGQEPGGCRLRTASSSEEHLVRY